MASVRIRQNKTKGTSEVTMVRQNRSGGLETVGSVVITTGPGAWATAVTPLGEAVQNIRAAERKLNASAHVQLDLRED